jgi:acyl-CoA synthetase (AMP-forming)/AMP-acid ligase II
MDVPSLMRQALSYNRDRTAVITEDQTLTFAQMWDRGVRLANGLIALGVRPGDRVAGLEENNLGAADLFLGAAIAGAVRVPLYARNRRLSHSQMIEQTQSKVVITDHTFVQDIAGLEHELPTLEHILDRGDDYESWLAAQSDVDPMVQVGPDDWYIIRHSAGTTGRPKGVGYTQHDWLVNCRNWFYRLPNLEVDSVVGHAGPISHASGYLFLPAWLHGSANLLFGAFDAAKVLSMIQRHQVTHAFAPPSMLAALAAHPDSETGDWSTLQCLLIGGAPSTDATILAGRRAFGDVLYQVFGQTEAVPLTIMTPKEWFSQTPGSVPLRAAGRPLPFAQIEIRDEQGVTLPLGEIGEIYAKVESQLRGFWNDDAATADRLVDGWIRTRDIGRVDTNGYLYVLDRADDMIVSGGFNIWPAELETVIADHPDVIEVAVFAVPHERWGETPMVVCYVEPGAKVTSEDVIALVTDSLGSYKKPTYVEFIHEPLPKSPVGKLMRKTLRDPHWAGRDTRVGGG